MQFYTVSQTSLAKSGSSVVEEYLPLWMADGSSASGMPPTASGSSFIHDGSTSLSNATVANLFNLNSSWMPSQKFAFEATFYTANSADPSYLGIYDITGSSLVSSSQISTSSTTATVVRSSTFTLTPGHTYAVTIWCPNGAGGVTNSVTDASLVVFGQ